MTQQQHGTTRLLVSGFGAALALGICFSAQAQAPAAPAPTGEYAPVPPHVEEAPVAAQGGYCFGGPHPADHAVAGATWDDTQGRHMHPYPPLDLRLFAVQDGCYYFIGDPSDFGYRGQTYQYYGAHPVHAGHGGGWCFMIGGHGHFWRPWSSFFVTAGPWFYWHGPYDPFFWNYWPYYAVYYNHYYPRYYRGGRYYQHGGHGGVARGGRYGGGRGFGGNGRGAVVAPPIGRVPAPVGPTAATRAAMPAQAGGNWGAGNWGTRSSAGPVSATPSGARWGEAPRQSVWPTRAAQPSAASSFRSSPGWGSVRSAPSSTTPSSGSSFRAAPSSGGGGGPRFTGPSAGGGFRR